MKYSGAAKSARACSTAWASVHYPFASLSQQIGEACLEAREAATSDWAAYVQAGLAYSGAARLMIQWDELSPARGLSLHLVEASFYRAQV